jgi:hypothetical protein
LHNPILLKLKVFIKTKRSLEGSNCPASVIIFKAKILGCGTRTPSFGSGCSTLLFSRVPRLILRRAGEPKSFKTTNPHFEKEDGAMAVFFLELARFPPGGTKFIKVFTKLTSV